MTGNVTYMRLTGQRKILFLNRISQSERETDRERPVEADVFAYATQKAQWYW